MRLIDENGKLTERGSAWRDDAKYAAVCAEIREEIYPQELRDLAPTAPVDAEAVNRWFLGQPRTGAGAAQQSRVVYELLTDTTIPTETPAKKPTSRQRPTSGASRRSGGEAEKAEPSQPVIPNPIQVDPSIHVAIQIYLNADTKPEQIDQIFEHMAKLIGK
jgi:hypothetical protein